jgi:glycine/D-amino acid oxidase-like deaminating enzyme
LQSWLKLPFSIKEHIVALRPTTAGQIPFIGIHPKHNAVAVFNGLGTRGFSAAPHWAKEFSALLIGIKEEMPDYDQARFQSFF